MAILQELRIAARTLLKRPGFTLIAVLALALGSGANTALFSVVNAVLLKPLPYRDPAGLVRIYETYVSSAGTGTGTVSGANLRDWREQNRSFDPLGAYAFQSANLQDVSEPERLSVVTITSDLLRSLGAKPLMGRAFSAGDDRADAPEVTVLSSGLWRRRFGADPEIVGKKVTLDGLPVTVVGVMSPDFEFPAGSVLTELWIPFRLTPEQWANRGSHQYFALGRLKPGVTIEMATADLKQIAARLAQLYPGNQQGRSVLLRPLHEDVSGNVRPALLTLMGAVGFVLLIACANVANLMLARAAGRTREVAVRIALGASRGRLIRQLVVESVLLSLAGGLAGVLLAYNGLPLLLQMGANRLPRTALGIDPTVLLFTLLVCLITGVAFGLAPALAALRPAILDSLKQGGRGSVGVQNRLFRNSLIAGEFALALVLLIGAGLLIKSFLVLNSTASGLRAENVITSKVALPLGKYPQGSASRLFYEPVLERLRAIPGVRAAGFISRLPLQEWGSNADFAIEGRPTTEAGKTPLAEYRFITPDYFRALGIPILRGRDVSTRDTPAAPPVVLINEAAALKYFSGEDPVGRRIQAVSNRWQTIVGMVGNVRQAGLDRNPLPEVYLPASQVSGSDLMSSMTMVVAGKVPPETLIGAIRSAVRSVDPNQPVYRVKTMERVLAESLTDRRLYLWLLVIFAGIALILASAGIYGVMSYLVTQRTAEFGLRMALGARGSDVLRTVLREASGLVLAGVVSGLVISLSVTQVLSTLLYGVSPRDWSIFAAVPLVLATVALAAAWIPAFRATRVDPTIALRYE